METLLNWWEGEDGYSTTELLTGLFTREPINNNAMETVGIKREVVTWMDLWQLFTTRNILLCLPSFTIITLVIFVIVSSVPFYGSLGVSSDSLLVFVVLVRAFEAVIDPFVAHWYESIRSDYTNEQQKRTQACLAASIVSGFMVGLHLSPPSSLTSDAALLGWFAWTYIFLFIALSFATYPLTALVWSAFPYNGAKEQYKRNTMALACEFLQNSGLAIVFILFGLSSAKDQEVTQTASVYGNCYSGTGVGQSCMAIPDTGHHQSYEIFNLNKWDTNSAYTCRQMGGETISDPALLYTPAHCLAGASEAVGFNSACLEEYCTCVGQCTGLYNLAARRGTMSAAGWLLGCLIMITVPALLYYLYGWAHLTSTAKSTRIGGVVEGSATTSSAEKGRPLESLVPKLVNLFRNKVVRSFLLPWLCDTLAFIMVIGSVGYFIRAVIRPEYAVTPVDCNAGIPIFGYDSASWRCQNRAVTSLLLTLVMISAVLSGVLWHYLAGIIGTVRAWQMGSLVSALCILTLVFSAKRDQTSKALGLGLLMGIGLGSRFLSEVVVIEVIHYYEFISGYQYQHTFAMLKLQLIKLSVVLMQILPIAVYYEVKFDPNPPMYVRSPLHLGQESSLAQLFVIAIPCLLSVASFLLKMQFRLVDNEQFDLTAEGIRALYHRKEAPVEPPAPVPPQPLESPGSSRRSKRTESAKAPPPAPIEDATVYGVDPTSGIHYPAAVLSYQELLGAQLFSHFADTQCTIDYHSCAHSQSPYIGVDLLINRMRDIAAGAFFVVVALCVAMVFAGDLLSSKTGLLCIPCLMIILMGWAVFVCYCAVQSLQAAIRLKDPAHQPSVETLDKIILNLDILADIAVVNLPTREVLRRIKEVQMADLIAAAEAEATGVKKKPGEDTKKDHDSRVSKETKELLAAEAYKASIPTKEMEVLEWEQALFRAAKRAVSRSKVPSQRALKLVRTLQKSCRLNVGNSDPALTRWEMEFYSYIASQHRKMQRKLQSGAEGSMEEKSGDGDSSMSDATAESSGSEGQRTRERNAKNGGGDAHRKPSRPTVVTVQSGRSVSSTYFKNLEDSDEWDSDLGSFGDDEPAPSPVKLSGAVHGHVHSERVGAAKPAAESAEGSLGGSEDGSEGFDLSSEDAESNVAKSAPSHSRKQSMASTGSRGRGRSAQSSTRRSSAAAQSNQGDEDGSVDYSLPSDDGDDQSAPAPGLITPGAAVAVHAVDASYSNPLSIDLGDGTPPEGVLRVDVSRDRLQSIELGDRSESGSGGSGDGSGSGSGSGSGEEEGSGSGEEEDDDEGDEEDGDDNDDDDDNLSMPSNLSK